MRCVTNFDVGRQAGRLTPLYINSYRQVQFAQTFARIAFVYVCMLSSALDTAPVASANPHKLGASTRRSCLQAAICKATPAAQRSTAAAPHAGARAGTPALAAWRNCCSDCSRASMSAISCEASAKLSPVGAGHRRAAGLGATGRGSLWAGSARRPAASGCAAYWLSRALTSSRALPGEVAR